MKRQLRIRTVLDARSRSTKYLFQLLLLVASWHKRVRKTAPLEVFIIGEPIETLVNFLEKFGVEWKIVPPDFNDAISKTSNTIIGARDTEGAQILLVDNDVVFLGDLKELTEVTDNVCMGAVAGSHRVNAARWELIENHFHLSLPPTTRIPLREHYRSLLDSNHTVTSLRNVYVNGGVLLLPAGVGFEHIWRKSVRDIGTLFENHPLKSGSVYGSNMAGLAVAIAIHGNFDWLKHKFNYRPISFALGLESFEQLQIVHLTGFSDSHRSVTRRLDSFWKHKMRPLFDKVRPAIGGIEEQNRLADIEKLFSELHNLVDRYELDHWAASFPRCQREFWKSSWHRHVNQRSFAIYGKVLRSIAGLRRRFAS